MKCRILRNFIWVFTVCQSTLLGVSNIRRVKGAYVVSTRILCAVPNAFIGNGENKYFSQYAEQNMLQQQRGGKCVIAMEGGNQWYLYCGHVFSNITYTDASESIQYKI